MIPADVLSAVLPVITAFENLGVRYHVGGSLASSLYGIPRTTLDVDLVADLRLEHVQPLVARLQGAYYVDDQMIADAIRRRAAFNVIHLDTMFKVDVFIRKLLPFEEEVFRRAQTAQVGEPAPREVFFASPEDVILHKLIWYKMGGEVSERQWTDILGVLKVQGGLDYAYLRQWAVRLEVEALLDRALTEAGS